MDFLIKRMQKLLILIYLENNIYFQKSNLNYFKNQLKGENNSYLSFYYYHKQNSR
jgi:hypothetical protein